MSDGQQKYEQVNIRRETFELLKREAKARDSSMTSLLSIAIRHLVKHLETEPKDFGL